MKTKQELYKEVLEKFDKKLSIDFWFRIFYHLYKDGKMSQKKMFSLLSEVNKNQT